MPPSPHSPDFLPLPQLIERAASLDLSALAHRLLSVVATRGVRPEALLQEYRRFLTLCAAVRNTWIVPSHLLDEVWHAHILDTRDYARVCEQLAGRLIHHTPGLGLAGSEVEHLRGWAATLDAYRDAFGEEAVVPIWGHPCASQPPKCGAPAHGFLAQSPPKCGAPAQP